MTDGEKMIWAVAFVAELNSQGAFGKDNIKAQRMASDAVHRARAVRNAAHPSYQEDGDEYLRWQMTKEVLS